MGIDVLNSDYCSSCYVQAADINRRRNNKTTGKESLGQITGGSYSIKTETRMNQNRCLFVYHRTRAHPVMKFDSVSHLPVDPLSVYTRGIRTNSNHLIVEDALDVAPSLQLLHSRFRIPTRGAMPSPEMNSRNYGT